MRKRKRLVKPPALVKGDAIGIFSPSEPLTSERRERLERGIALLRSLGFEVVLAKNIFKSSYYTAGTPEERVSDIHDLLEDGRVKALMTSWGGRSSNQLLDLLDYSLFEKNPKIISGFSDSTTIVNAIYAKADLVTFYGPNVVGKLAEGTRTSVEYFQRAFITGKLGRIESGTPAIAFRAGSAEGPLVGGNLTCFDLGLVGTSYLPQLEGAIFFWESGSRTPQEIDQYLTHMRLCGVFEKISGMLIGFVGQNTRGDRWGNRKLQDVVLEATRNYEFPIMQLPTFGHGDVDDLTLPIGCRCLLDADKLQLEILEDSVSHI